MRKCIIIIIIPIACVCVSECVCVRVIKSSTTNHFSHYGSITLKCEHLVFYESRIYIRTGYIHVYVYVQANQE
uniref:Secreted protein n=1 Tax=Octopus bimaculoides TaxID=37653 RepID=A0A0L8FPI6_OCTBM